MCGSAGSPWIRAATSKRLQSGTKWMQRYLKWIKQVISMKRQEYRGGALNANQLYTGGKHRPHMHCPSTKKWTSFPMCPSVSHCFLLLESLRGSVQVSLPLHSFVKRLSERQAFAWRLPWCPQFGPAVGDVPRADSNADITLMMSPRSD